MATYTTGQMSGLEFELGNRRYEGDYTVTYTDESGAVLFEETSTRQGVVRSTFNDLVNLAILTGKVRRDGDMLREEK